MWPTIIKLACVCLQHGRPDLGHEPPCSPGSSWEAYLLPLGLLLSQMGKSQKRPGTYKQLRPQDLRAKHGSTLDTITNPFVGPHIFLLAPALMTLAFNHLFPLLLALGTGWLAHGQP